MTPFLRRLSQSPSLRLAALMALTILTITTATEAQRRGGGRRSERADLSQFSFRVEEFQSKSLGDKTASYGVYLPADYTAEENAQTRYPWAIWLHGMRGSLHRFRDRGAAIFDKMREADQIPEMILITPSAGRMPLYMNGGAHGDLEDMILKELWADVEQKFRVSKKRHERAIMGVSMGALGALKMALRFPKKFGTVAIHSGPVLPADPEEMSGRFQRYARFMQIDRIFGDPINKKKWAAEIPMAIIQTKSSKAFAGLRIYLDAGSDDRYGFGAPNRGFSKALKARDIKHTFRYITGGGHSWGSGAIQSAMKVSFPFVAKGFANRPTTSKKSTDK